MTTNIISKELEIQIVLRWWDKLKYITTVYGDSFIKEQPLVIYEVDGDSWQDSQCVELVVNVYEEQKRQADNQYKQNLLDKKDKLMAELAEIDEELGE